MDAARAVMGQGRPFSACPRSNDGVRGVSRSDTRMPGRVSFAYFSLHEQRKVRRPRGRNTLNHTQPMRRTTSNPEIQQQLLVTVSPATQERRMHANRKPQTAWVSLRSTHPTKLTPLPNPLPQGARGLIRVSRASGRNTSQGYSRKKARPQGLAFLHPQPPIQTGCGGTSLTLNQAA